MAIAADIVLTLHALFVLFVVIGLMLIVIGWWRRWRWVRNPWFRYLHLLAIAFVVLEAWVGLPCPLTLLENALRIAADGAPYASSFVGYWLQRLLYYNLPAAVFAGIYTVFLVLVLVSWFVCPPRAGQSMSDQGK